MMRSELLIALMSMKHLLGATKANSIALQGSSLELPQSKDHIRTCVTSFNNGAIVKAMAATKKSILTQQSLAIFK